MKTNHLRLVFLIHNVINSYEKGLKKIINESSDKLEFTSVLRYGKRRFVKERNSYKHWNTLFIQK